MSNWVQVNVAKDILGLNINTLHSLHSKDMRNKRKSQRFKLFNGLLYADLDEWFYCPRAQYELMNRFYDLMSYFDDDENALCVALVEHYKGKLLRGKYCHWYLKGRLLDMLNIQVIGKNTKENVKNMIEAMDSLKEKLNAGNKKTLCK